MKPIASFCKPISLLMLLLCSTALSASDNVADSLSLCQLNDKYLSSDIIKLSLTNQSNRTLYYSVSLQEKIGDEWIAIVEDTFRSEGDAHTVKNMHLIVHKDQKEVYHALPRILNESYTPYGICRLCYTILESPFDPIGEVIYSSAFLIEQEPF